MLKIKPPKYKFCPFCGKLLQTKIEEGKVRKYCPKDKWTYYPHVFQSAVAVILRGNKILLVKRNREPYKKTWMFPAGFLDFGEHPEETALREVREEVGLTAKNPGLIQIIQSTDDPRAPGHLIFFYKVDASGKIKNFDKEENSEIGWFDIDKPPNVGWKSHKYILKNLQKRRV